MNDSIQLQKKYSIGEVAWHWTYEEEKDRELWHEGAKKREVILNESYRSGELKAWKGKDDLIWVDVNDLKEWASNRSLTLEFLDSCEIPANIARKKWSTTERNKMLSVILGMAIDKYGYDTDPKAKRNLATGDNKGSISASLQCIGFKIEADTIRKYINEALELYPEVRQFRKEK